MFSYLFWEKYMMKIRGDKMGIQIKDPKKARTIIAATMFMFAFFNSAYVQLNTPLLSSMIETQGWTNETLCNLIVTIGNLAQIPAYLLGAVLGKKMDKKKLTYISVLCFLIGGLLIIPLSFNIYLVLLCRFIVGCGSGMLILISTAILPDFFEGPQLSSVIGLVLAGSGFWGFIFANIVGVIAANYGWKTAYLLHLYAVVPLILFAWFIPNKPLVDSRRASDHPENAAETKAVHTGNHMNPMVYVYTLAGMFSFMLVQGMWSNSSIWITDTLGGTIAQAGIASSVISLFSFFGRMVFGRVYSKLGRFTLHLNIILLIIGMFLASSAETFITALVAIAFVGVAMGFVAPTALNRCIEVSPRTQETAQAVTSIGFALGNFSSTYWKLFLNQVSSGSLSSVFHINTYFCIGFLILAFVISLLLIQKEKSQK